MASNSDDADDEYLDDPISLMAIDIKQEKCDDDIIEISTSSDEEDTYISSYGKKSFVLPVTFFDVSRNIRLLNKCKPMSIKIVDCKQYPTYYSNCTENSRTNSDNVVQADNKCENKPETDSVQIVTNDRIAVDKVDEEHEGNKLNTGNLNMIPINHSILVPTVEKKHESEKANTHVQNIVNNNSITGHKVNEIQERLEPNPNSVQDVVISDSITVHEVRKQEENKPVTDVRSMVIGDNITLHKFDKKYDRGKTNTEVPCVVINESITVRKLDNNQIRNDSITVPKVDKKQEENKPLTDVRSMVIDDNITLHKFDKKYERDKTNTDASCVIINESITVHKLDNNQIGNRPNIAVQNTVTNDSVTIQKHEKKQEGKKKRASRGHSFYEKLNRRKEITKKIALSSRNFSQVDFKRNTGLVGLKITDTVFKQIVISEKTRKGKDFSDKKITKTNIRYVENQYKKSNENTTTIKANEKSESDIYMKEMGAEKEAKKSSAKTSINTEIDKPYKKSDSYTKKVCVEKEAEKTFVKTSISCEINKTYENTGSNTEKIGVEKEAEKRSTKTIVSFGKEKFNENNKNHNYMKEVGVALDNLGTTIIPLADTDTINHASKNVTGNIDNVSIKAQKSSAPVVDKPKTNNNIGIRCSIRIPSKKTVEKVLKLKKIAYDSKHKSDDKSQKIDDQRSPKESIANGDQTGPNLNVKYSQPNYNSSFVGSEKKNLKGEGEKKQVLKSVDIDASKKYQPGSNSPVIPCTTITPRPGPPKSLQKISPPKNTTESQKPNDITASITQTNGQKNSSPKLQVDKPSNTSSNEQKRSTLPKVCTGNQADSSNISKKVDSPQHNKSYPNITVVSHPIRTTVSNENSPAHINAMKIAEDRYPNIYPLVRHLFDIKNQSESITEHQLPEHISKTNQTNRSNQHTPVKSVTGNITNQSTNGLIQNQTHPNPQTSSSNNSKLTGINAIIFRRPPPPPSRNVPSSELANQGHRIQTLINHRPQYQVPFGSPMRFRLPPPLPPPNYVPNLANQRFMPPGRMASPCLRGPGITLHRFRFPGPCPPSYTPPLPMQQITQCMRPPPPPPRVPLTQENFRLNPAPLPEVSKDSFIGTTSNGDPIKKISILPQTNTVNDKQMMLAELNSAMMSPELISNKQEDEPHDLMLKADPKPAELVKPKYTKPCPLSKKLNVATVINKPKVPDQPLKIGYSPPILPIWTYEESFQRFGQNDLNMKRRFSTNDIQDHTPSKVKCTSRIMKLDKKLKTPNSKSGKQDIAKKITFEDYRKRVSGDEKTDAAKIRKLNEVKNVADDYNQDLGYDSDTTVKL